MIEMTLSYRHRIRNSLTITKHISEASLLVTKICHHTIFFITLSIPGWLTIRQFKTKLPGVLLGTFQDC